MNETTNTAPAAKLPTLTAQLRAYFGFKPGQTVASFAAEIKAIQPQRAEWAAMLTEAGYPCSA